jgi:ATP-binding cassette subfamily B protein RaxB
LRPSPVHRDAARDGIPLSTFGPRVYREHIAAVMQEDQLLSGSIAENISFFATSLDEEWMIRCAEMACIHDEIMRMPMAYNSPIGDMGSALSGGQRQRIILARALYRRPKILFLDEATAHLDWDNERQISEHLKALNITRISISHRSDLSDDVDLKFHLAGEERLPLVLEAEASAA